MATALSCWFAPILFLLANCEDILITNSDPTCTTSEFAFRLSNTDMKINKCYLSNNADDMAWMSGCNKDICNANKKHAFLTIESIDPNHIIWPDRLDEIFLNAFNRLALHYKRYALLNRPYKLFFMSHRQTNGSKYIRSNNMIYGAIHMTLKYLCCYTEIELQQIMQLLQGFEWESFQITLKKMICLYSDNEIHFPFVFDTQSQIWLKQWTFKFEKYMEKNNIKVKQCRKDFEPFHVSFISIKYFHDELKSNKQNILNNAITYIHDINNHIINSDYDFSIEFNKDMIMHSLFIAAKSSRVFGFNNQSYIGI